MQKIRRIILLFSSVFLFYHTSNLHAITYEYVTFGNMAYGSGSNTGSGSGSGTGGAPSTTPGSHYEYPEIYQQQPTAEEAQAKAEVYLFLAALGRCCCTRAFSNCGERGAILHCGSWASHCTASLVVEHGP